MSNDLRKNGSGYYDPTSYTVMIGADIDNKIKSDDILDKIIEEIYNTCKRHNFNIDNKVIFVQQDTRKCYGRYIKKKNNTPIKQINNNDKWEQFKKWLLEYKRNKENMIKWLNKNDKENEEKYKNITINYDEIANIIEKIDAENDKK